MIQWLRLHASTVGALRSLVRELRLYMLHDTAKKKTLPVFKLCLWLVVCYWAAVSGLSLGHLVQPHSFLLPKSAHFYHCVLLDVSPWVFWRHFKLSNVSQTGGLYFFPGWKKKENLRWTLQPVGPFPSSCLLPASQWLVLLIPFFLLNPLPTRPRFYSFPSISPHRILLFIIFLLNLKMASSCLGSPLWVFLETACPLSGHTPSGVSSQWMPSPGGCHLSGHGCLTLTPSQPPPAYRLLLLASGVTPFCPHSPIVCFLPVAWTIQETFCWRHPWSLDLHLTTLSWRHCVGMNEKEERNKTGNNWLELKVDGNKSR